MKKPEYEYIYNLQKYAVSILKEGNEAKSLWMLAKYNCSEVSWLVGLKVLGDLGPTARPFILKGDVNNSDFEKEENLHDILGYFDPISKKYIVVDPTIWQFYPRRRSIYVGAFSSLRDAIKEISKIYAGDWPLSYYVDESNDDIAACKRIIRLNCDQAPKWKGQDKS